MQLVREIIDHGGIRGICIEEVEGGYQNTVVCQDYHRIPLTKEQEKVLMEMQDPIPVGFQA